MVEDPLGLRFGRFFRTFFGATIPWHYDGVTSFYDSAPLVSVRVCFVPCCSGASAEIAVEKDVRSAGEHSCQICFEHDHSTAMLPCGHGGVCWDCGLQIYALTQECPMCRVKIGVVSALCVNVGIKIRARSCLPTRISSYYTVVTRYAMRNERLVCNNC